MFSFTFKHHPTVTAPGPIPQLQANRLMIHRNGFTSFPSVLTVGVYCGTSSNICILFLGMLSPRHLKGSFKLSSVYPNCSKYANKRAHKLENFCSMNKHRQLPHTSPQIMHALLCFLRVFMYILSTTELKCTSNYFLVIILFLRGSKNDLLQCS